ncbi:MAG: DUF1553 domain-containing protein [Pedosphaera sp.]|nr:DUF1553 domain-containing protein [Pedosphaera sp.]
MDYVQTIKPLLTRHCVSCHGVDKPKGNLRLDTGAAAIRGGDSGPALLPGKPTESLLLQVVVGEHASIDRMPYRRPPLDPEAIGQLSQWIVDGALVPKVESPGVYRHWAFEPSVRPSVPRFSGARSPIDAFIQSRMATAGIQPSPLASAATRLRRVTLDLTGLPPSPEEIRLFNAKASFQEYARITERLLASKSYGERWGRWWLDVARYADSNGYSVDAPRSMWPWRDWVVESLNGGLPFDQFIIEQLAGDLIANPTVYQKLATGFHRNTQINQEGGIDLEQFRIESVFDRVATTGTVFLGLSVGCAQCHDHKFDPISQREYYGMFAFFNDQEEPMLELPSLDPTAVEIQSLLAENRAELGRRNAQLNLAVERWELALTEVVRAKLDKSVRAAGIRDAAYEQLQTRVEELQSGRYRRATSLVLAERSQPRETRLFIKGDFTRPAELVPPLTPAALPPLKSAQLNGRANRLDLARWLVAPENPLTARVMVNRVWQQYFGRGLVETENDFGTQGSPASHPELLDWLAVEFRDSGWNLKHIHRLITGSETYQRSSQSRPDLAVSDPRNLLLSHQVRLRLDAEVIRDVALTAGRLLDRSMGGPPVQPPQPEGLGAFTQSHRVWAASEGGNRYRRALYTSLLRSTLHPALAVFDAPNSFTSCTRRLRSNTPLQALTLLNDTQFYELAIALGKRMETGSGSVAIRLAEGFLSCTGRVADTEEIRRLEQMFSDEKLDGSSVEMAWLALGRVLLNLDETITRE